MTAKIILILSGCIAVLTIGLLLKKTKRSSAPSLNGRAEHTGPEVSEAIPPEISGFAWNQRSHAALGSFGFSVMKNGGAQDAVLECRLCEESSGKAQKQVGIAVSETDWDRLIRILLDADLVTAPDNEINEEPDGTVSSFYVTTAYDGEWKCRLPRKETLDALYSLLMEIVRKA